MATQKVKTKRAEVPGAKTSEFWGKTILQVVLGVIVFLPQAQDVISDVIPYLQYAVDIIAVVMAGLVEAGYAKSRAEVKKAEVEKSNK